MATQIATHMRKKKTESVPPKLSEGEQDLISKMAHGYQLETDSLGANPVLRRLKDNEMFVPASANASTVKALEKQGHIRPGRSRDPLTIVWRLNKKETY